MKDEYQSIAADVRASLKVEGSEFIASAFPVDRPFAGRGNAHESA